MQQGDPQAKNNQQQWYFVSKIVLTYCENFFKISRASSLDFGLLIIILLLLSKDISGGKKNVPGQKDPSNMMYI